MDLPANRPIVLEEAWFVEKGEINLFAIKVVQGKPEGTRTLITHFEGPTVLFPASFNGDYELVAYTETPCTLNKISLQQIEPPFLQKWLNGLAEFYKKESLVEAEKFLPPLRSIQLEKGETVAAKRAISHEEKKEILWVQVDEGEFEFLGKPSLRLTKGEGPFPLTYNAWIKSQDKAQLTSLKMGEDWQEGLRRFHTTFYAYLLVHQKEEFAFQSDLAEKRHKHEEEGVHASLSEMAKVLNPFEGKEILEGVDPIFRVCKLIGEEMGIEFLMPPEASSLSNATQHVSAICRASEIRYRQVRLTKEWWKKDSGPLLGFYGEAFKPVAFFPKGSSHYEMVDPDTREKTLVDRVVAKQIIAVAYCFYRPFPDELKRGSEVMRFFVKHNRKEFLPLIIYSILAAIIALFPPLATHVLFSRVIPEVNYSLFWQVSGGLFLAALSMSLFLYFRYLTVVRIEGCFSNQIQSALWDRLLKLRTHFFRRYSTGNMINRIISVEFIRSLLSGPAMRAIFSGLFSLFYLIAMFLYAPALAVISIVIVTVMLLLTVVIAYAYVRIEKEVYEIQGRINGFLVQIITAVGKLRTSGAEKNAFSQWAFSFAKNTKLELKAQNIRSLLFVLNYILPYALYLALFGFVIENASEYNVGSFLAFNIALIPFYVAMTDLSQTLGELAPIIPLWNRSKVILEAEQEERVKDQKPGVLTGEISVDEVVFKYEGSDALVLNNVSIKVNPKEFIALVGPSGCGKSTLVRMLLGFEKPHSGGVFYNGKDLSSVAIGDVRRQLGVVLQEEGIVAGSIYDNLVCGGIYPPERIEHALEISGFKTDLENLPMGIHTYLPMGGTTLSGGQKQRLLIARALLPNPKILIFDEATSALDNKNQKHVMENIEELDVTRIVIAHRLSTIRHADRIYVMEKGHMAQVGTFEELSSAPGLFATMLERQKL